MCFNLCFANMRPLYVTSSALYVTYTAVVCDFFGVVCDFCLVCFGPFIGADLGRFLA